MNNFKQVMQDMRDREEKAAKAANLQVIGTVADFVTGKVKEAWLYVQVGGDRMLPIARANSNGDVWTKTNGIESWWCCCANTPVYGK